MGELLELLDEHKFPINSTLAIPPGQLSSSQLRSTILQPSKVEQSQGAAPQLTSPRVAMTLPQPISLGSFVYMVVSRSFVDLKVQPLMRAAEVNGNSMGAVSLFKP